METFSFELKLIDGVTATSKKLAAGVDAIKGKADHTTQQLGKLQSAALKMNSAFDASKMNGATKALEAQMRAATKVEAAVRKMGLAQIQAMKMDKLFGEKKAQGNSFLGGFGQKLGFRSVADYAKGAFVGELAASAVMGIAGAFTSGAEKAVALLSSGIQRSFKTAAGEEQLQIGERNVLGVKGAKDFREDADSFAKKTPFDDGVIRQMMLPLRRAGIGQAASKQMFATATDIGGGDAGAVSGVLAQLQGIHTRNGVSKKQLVELLGATGDTIPEFYKSLGNKLHISAKEAAKRAENNGIDGQLITNMITEAVNKRQGGAAGTGGERFADSLGREYDRLLELPDQFFKKFANSPAFDKTKEALGRLLDNLDPDSANGKRIMGALDATFTKLVDVVDKLFTPENIDKFSSGLMTAATAAASLAGSVAKILEFYNGVSGNADAISKLGGGDADKGNSKLLADNLPNLPKIKAADDIWDKVKSVESIGWWKDLNMEPDERRAIMKSAVGKREISPEEYSVFDRYSAGKRDAAPVTVNVGGITVTGNDDPKRAAEAIAAHIDHAVKAATAGSAQRSISNAEHAAQEGG